MARLYCINNSDETLQPKPGEILYNANGILVAGCGYIAPEEAYTDPQIALYVENNSGKKTSAKVHLYRYSLKENSISQIREITLNLSTHEYIPERSYWNSEGKIPSVTIRVP